MDDTQESVLSTLDEIEESELERAAEFAYVDNIMTCSCIEECVCERGEETLVHDEVSLSCVRQRAILALASRRV